MMGFCRDCKFWDADVWEGDERDWRGVCLLIFGSGRNSFKMPADIIMRDGESGVAAELFTAPDFGCMMFEEKEVV